MVHPKNQRDVGRSSKGGMDLLGSARLWRWKRENGLAGVCMEWLWKGLARCGGEGSSGTTVFPQTQRVRLVSLCVGVTEPLPFLLSGQAMET